MLVVALSMILVLKPLITYSFPIALHKIHGCLPIANTYLLDLLNLLLLGLGNGCLNPMLNIIVIDRIASPASPGSPQPLWSFLADVQRLLALTRASELTISGRRNHEGGGTNPCVLDLFRLLGFDPLTSIMLYRCVLDCIQPFSI